MLNLSSLNSSRVVNRACRLLFVVSLYTSRGEALGNAPEVAVQPAETEFASGRDVRLWISLRNVGEGCLPIFIDPRFMSETSERRPHTVVSLAVRDHRGARVIPRRAFDPQTTYLRIHELMLLRCSSSFGQELDLARLPWSYNLGPGTYSVRVSVKVPVRSFLERAARKQELEQLWAPTSDPIEAFIRDSEGESGWVEFRVR
jgi:hypothetical protein